MTAHIAAHGRLVVDVQSKAISNGNTWHLPDLRWHYPAGMSKTVNLHSGWR
jgi:hypothetical protein